jgi:hypothetical protein
MIAKVILSAFFVVLDVSAFEIYTYTSKQCTGTSAKIQLGVADGCNTFRAGESQAIIMYDLPDTKWLSWLIPMGCHCQSTLRTDSVS